MPRFRWLNQCVFLVIASRRREAFKYFYAAEPKNAAEPCIFVKGWDSIISLVQVYRYLGTLMHLRAQCAPNKEFPAFLLSEFKGCELKYIGGFDVTSDFWIKHLQTLTNCAEQIRSVDSNPWLKSFRRNSWQDFFLFRTLHHELIGTTYCASRSQIPPPKFFFGETPHRPFFYSARSSHYTHKTIDRPAMYCIMYLQCAEQPDPAAPSLFGETPHSLRI